MTQRKYLTQTEVELILRDARKGKFGERNYCLLYLSFIHGFRVSEEWFQYNPSSVTGRDKESQKVAQEKAGYVRRGK